MPSIKPPLSLPPPYRSRPDEILFLFLFLQGFTERLSVSRSRDPALCLFVIIFCKKKNQDSEPNVFRANLIEKRFGFGVQVIWGIYE